MACFHSVHSNGVELHSNGREAVKQKGFSDFIVFSGRPLRRGDKFRVRIVENNVGIECGTLFIGLTAINPEEWAGLSQRDPIRLPNTWYMWTHNGTLWTHGGEAGYQEDWRERFGFHHEFNPGDILLIDLDSVGFVNVTHNENEVYNIFTDYLPDQPLWVVMSMGVKKMEIV